MRAVFVVLALVAAAAASEWNLLTKEEAYTEAETRELFATFKTTFGKQYRNKVEEIKRYNVFREFVEFVRAHNQREARGEETYKTAINHLCDLTHAEYAAQYLQPMNRTRPLNVRTIGSSASNPSSIDWRSKGAVTPVKNQGQCGSCWSFSTTGSVEGRYQIATGSLRSLSEQQLMDCSTAEGDHSCNGGLMDYAFEYIIKNDGIDSESDYPYLARNEACESSKESRHVADITGFHDVPKSSDSELENAVAEGPVSVAIEADQRGFQTYHSGVFSGECGTQLDHGVLAVGYGEDSGQKYWIVKNSWGATWGDDGYIKLVRDSSNPDGQCGINLAASYPVAKNGPAPPPGPPSPSPPPPPPGPSGDDYEDPKPNGCHAGEEAVRINGISGDYCAPSCNGQGSACPAPPAGTDAQGECVVEKAGSSGPTLCALICQPNSDAACPGTATCKPIQGVGVCTYDD